MLNINKSKHQYNIQLEPFILYSTKEPNFNFSSKQKTKKI